MEKGHQSCDLFFHRRTLIGPVIFCLKTGQMGRLQDLRVEISAVFRDELAMMTAFNQMLMNSCGVSDVPLGSTNAFKADFKALYTNTSVWSLFTMITSFPLLLNVSQFTISLFRSTLNFSIQSATLFQGDLYPFVVLCYDYQEHRRQPARRLSYTDNGPRYTWSGLPSGRLEMITRTNKRRRVR